MPRPLTRRRAAVLLLGVLALAMAVRSDAQFRRGRGFGTARLAVEQDFDGRWHFCRAVFAGGFGGDGGGWSVDYPRADLNMSMRLSELTKTDVSRQPSGDPNFLLVRFTDPLLFSCPWVMMTEVGSAALSNAEGERMREYLLKGGFIWADDFWGSRAWEWWEAQISRVLPPDEYPIIELTPDHPLFHTQFDVKKVPQIASINFWASTGSTSERGADSAHAAAKAILDSHGRVMVLMTHNTDLGDSWEREGDDPSYFLNFSVDGYAFGINAMLYAMTH